jgi:hypothetical protein
MTRCVWTILLACMLGSRLAAVAAAAEGSAKPPSCREDAAYAKLDFWLGQWEVFDAKGARDGDNRIEKALGGCAILEHWRAAADGSEGQSLFYYRRAEKRWKQVWVTDSGGVKEKAEVLDFPGPGLRFQGEIPLPSGGTILDRTTLTLLTDGRVRQVIEQSRDGGKSWSGWEGIYVRRRI